MHWQGTRHIRDTSFWAVDSSNFIKSRMIESIVMICPRARRALVHTKMALSTIMLKIKLNDLRKVPSSSDIDTHDFCLRSRNNGIQNLPIAINVKLDARKNDLEDS